MSEDRIPAFMEQDNTGFAAQLPLCVWCAYKTPGMATCMAYPNGIPEKFITGTIEHTKPEPDDNGIQFRDIREEPK